MTESEEESSGWGISLRAALDRSGLKSFQLAERMSVSQATVSTWLSGKRTPEPPTVFRLEEVLRVPPGSISHHLGYLPVSDPVTFDFAEPLRTAQLAREVLTADPRLSEDDIEIIMRIIERALS